ncbi:MAG: DUF2225 domain-containing protein [Syntrophomonadaceae bacterium]|nr:DUF2225 domain-containing protein [Syntrophomonadaceae bacterium]
MRNRLWGDFMTANNPFFEKKFACPVCKTNFTSLAVRSSRVYVERKESDLHVIYRGVSPLHYSIIVCPACYYAASNNGFSQEINPILLEKLIQALYQLRPEPAIEYNQERDLEKALGSFKLAIRSGQLKQVRAGELAGLFLGAAWVARETQNQELENVYLKEALTHYLEAYNKDFQSIGNMSDVQATYLIGELYRRNGDSKEAVNWFNKVIVHKYIKKYPQIEKLTREQWALAREQAQLQPVSEGATVQPAVQLEERPENNTHTAPASNANKIASPQRRPSMQMPAHLYADQIDWLTRIVNNGYNSTKTLVSKEQVLRALLDAVIKNLGDNLPEQFSNEEELKALFGELLTRT